MMRESGLKLIKDYWELLLVLVIVTGAFARTEVQLNYVKNEIASNLSTDHLQQRGEALNQLQANKEDIAELRKEIRHLAITFRALAKEEF